jgi:hypothetical protein
MDCVPKAGEPDDLHQMLAKEPESDSIVIESRVRHANSR